jgi:hypothetical protein
MSDLSLDWCELCGRPVAGVMSGPHCKIVYVSVEDEEGDDVSKGVCLDCVQRLILARNQLSGSDLDDSFVWTPGLAT